MKHISLTRSFILLVTFCAAFSSCKKDDEQEISINSISGAYRVTAMSEKIGTMPEEDLMQYLPACEKDNTITLKNDKTYTIADVGTICTPPSNDNGFWDVPSSKKIELDSDEYDIDSFDGKILKMSQTDNSSGQTEIYRITITKQ